MNCRLKRAIHHSSTVEFLEHGKEKPVVSFKNRWELAPMDESDGIPNSLKADWNGRVQWRTGFENCFCQESMGPIHIYNAHWALHRRGCGFFT
ncbi:hypothetical protein AVEN_189997-1 [Araneus ventricosus]|uniref:Uncharacterized protein n=1 Tax=Araneus ventricosus TaxID=182803 RepID=A0A4Y2DDW8_ARAVE|nr:hypothetical protein AVEN_64867-1 [Araneus ventricosus]GBO06094.1 hypothetical protein AVEN_189997-1 [Araneus ventricosus]